MAALLARPPTDAALTEFHGLLAEFSDAGPARAATTARRTGPRPGAADARRRRPPTLFERYRDALRAGGVTLPATATAGGAAGLGDALHGMLARGQGGAAPGDVLADEEPGRRRRQAGLGPLLGRLPAGRLRVHLVGHSFGARLVSYALAGLPDGPSPVKSVTLLQGAFSHFAFARPLPFDAGRNGALAGMLARIDGPLTACFSSHDLAVGRFYPLASLAARDDSAGAQDALFRWGGMGADGAQGVQAALTRSGRPGPAPLPVRGRARRSTSTPARWSGPAARPAARTATSSIPS